MEIVECRRTTVRLGIDFYFGRKTSLKETHKEPMFVALYLAGRCVCLYCNSTPEKYVISEEHLKAASEPVISHSLEIQNESPPKLVLQILRCTSLYS